MKKCKEIYNKKGVFIVIMLVLVASIIEVVVCNYSSIKVLFNSNKNIQVEFGEEDSDYSTFATLPEYNDNYKLIQKSFVIKKQNFDIESINFYVSNVDKTTYGVVDILSSSKSETNLIFMYILKTR